MGLLQQRVFSWVGRTLVEIIMARVPGRRPLTAHEIDELFLAAEKVPIGVTVTIVRGSYTETRAPGASIQNPGDPVADEPQRVNGAAQNV